MAKKVDASSPASLGRGIADLKDKFLQRFSQLLGTGGVGATPPRRGFTPAPRIQTARKVLYRKPKFILGLYNALEKGYGVSVLEKLPIVLGASVHHKLQLLAH